MGWMTDELATWLRRNGGCGPQGLTYAKLNPEKGPQKRARGHSLLRTIFPCRLLPTQSYPSDPYYRAGIKRSAENK